MELIDGNFVIDLIENQKSLTNKQAVCYNGDILVFRVFYPGLLEDFLAKGLCLQECQLLK